ncbi:MAG TPA: TraX family protein [Thermoclostridium sp.]|nr:TraX family protein [Thermoclostridium sp.]
MQDSIALYNSNRDCKAKYFFYMFYPVHLVVLYAIGWMILEMRRITQKNHPLVHVLHAVVHLHLALRL